MDINFSQSLKIALAPRIKPVPLPAIPQQELKAALDTVNAIPDLIYIDIHNAILLVNQIAISYTRIHVVAL